MMWAAYASLFMGRREESEEGAKICVHVGERTERRVEMSMVSNARRNFNAVATRVDVILVVLMKPGLAMKFKLIVLDDAKEI